MLYQLDRLFTNKWHQKMATFSELAKIGEEMFLAYFMVLIQHLPGEREEYHISQDSQCLG
jgi:hypothetical protein